MNKIIESVNQTPVGVKVGMDLGAVGLAWGSFFTDVLPVVATMLSVVWFTLQIYAWFVNKKWKKEK